MAIEVVKSVCGLCAGSCGVLITLEDGRPVGIEGDPDSPPKQGGLCKIGRASLEYLNHPDRLKHPLKRTGERGARQWQRISWDEARSYSVSKTPITMCLLMISPHSTGKLGLSTSGE